MSNLKQIDVRFLWENMELALSGKTGKPTKITINDVCQHDEEFTKYVVNNLGEELWDNALYLARVVERLYEIYGYGDIRYLPLYWLGDEPEWVE